MGDVVDAALSVQPLVRERAEACEEHLDLTDDVVDALVDAGLMRLCVPAAYGGPEATPMQLVEAVEAVAEADGATGWCAMIASTTSSMSMFLSREAAGEIFGDTGVVTGGAFAPSGRAHQVGGGWRLGGRWAWGSGTHHAQWVLGGCMTDTDEFHLMFAPAEQATFHDTWDPLGLRGTGSGDFELTDVFVPDGFTMRPGVTPPVVDVPLAHFPNFTLLAAAVASTTLGIARRAIDEAVALAQAKTPAYSTRRLGQSPTVQIGLSQAEARLGAGRAFLLDALSTAWDDAVRGDRVTIETRARIRLAALHAVESAVAATDAAYLLGGGSAVHRSHPLQRCLRDVHTATQHVQVSPRMHETIGRVLLGERVDTATL
jgi:alkylation response protein AidB-like acyl-CoA dehydrogenase